MSQSPIYERFQQSSVPPTVSNAHIHSFAVNELTRELLYVTNSHITLVSLESLAELRRIPFANLIRTDSVRQSDRKFQEVLQQYVNFGLNFLSSLPHLNIWLGVLNKRRIVCLSEELEVSNEVTLDSSGVLSISVHPSTGDVFILGVEGKVFVLAIEYSYESLRKRLPTLYDFEIKVNSKKQIGTEGLLTHLSISSGASTFLLASTDASTSQLELHIWNYTTGEKLPSITHSDSASVAVSVQALAACGTLVALMDSNRNLAVYDFLLRQEVVRYQVPASVGSVEAMVIEDPDIAAGMYVIDSGGRVFDFVQGQGVGSVYVPSRPRDSLTPSVTRNADRGSSAKQSPAPIHQPPHCTLVTQHSGLKQLWLLTDGFLDVISLASIGRLTDFRGVVRVEARYDNAYLYYEKGGLDVFDPRRERVSLHIDNVVSGFTDRENPNGSYLPAFCAYLPDLNFMAYISTTGLLKLYDLDSDVASINFVLQKKVFTSACFIQQRNTENSFDCVFGTNIGEVLIMSYDKLNREVTPRRKYAAHDQVVMVSYLQAAQKVMSVGREGTVRFLSWPEYRWDNTVFRGFWADCTACALCGNSILLIGYDSGMLQTLYISFGSTHPAASLLEYHIFAVTAVSGLPNSNSEAVSGDSAGYIVLWNLDQGRPCKVFSVQEEVTSLALFGATRSEKLLVVLKGICVFLSLRTKNEYVNLSPKDIAKWREDRAKKRTEYKGRKLVRKADMRSSSLAALEDGVKREDRREGGAVAKLLAKVRVAKSIVEKDPLNVSPPRRHIEPQPRVEMKNMTDNWYRTYRNRPLTRILEHNRVERLKKSVSKVIQHFGVDIPSELAFSGGVMRKFSPALTIDRASSRRSTQSRLDRATISTERNSSRPATSFVPRSHKRTVSQPTLSPYL